MLRCAACGAFNRIRRDHPAGSPVCGRCKRALDETNAPQAVNGTELQATIERSPLPVLVDFWAGWCGPCIAAMPIVKDVAKQLAGRVVVLKLDTEAWGEVAAAHHIQALPTFVLFHQGRELARRPGLLPREALLRFADQASADAGAHL